MQTNIDRSSEMAANSLKLLLILLAASTTKTAIDIRCKLPTNSSLFPSTLQLQYAAEPNLKVCIPCTAPSAQLLDHIPRRAWPHHQASACSSQYVHRVTSALLQGKTNATCCTGYIRSKHSRSLPKGKLDGCRPVLLLVWYIWYSSSFSSCLLRPARGWRSIKQSRRRAATKNNETVIFSLFFTVTLYLSTGMQQSLVQQMGCWLFLRV